MKKIALILITLTLFAVLASCAAPSDTGISPPSEATVTPSDSIIPTESVPPLENVPTESPETSISPSPSTEYIPPAEEIPSVEPSPSKTPAPSKTPSPSASVPSEIPSISPSEPPVAEESDLSLEDIMDAVLKDIPDLPRQFYTELTADNFSAFLFIDPIDGAEGLSSDSMIGSIAHSVCLLRLPDGSDPAKIAERIEKNADPRKWICVEAEKTIVKYKGNIVLLVMSFEKIADAAAANFEDMDL